MRKAWLAYKERKAEKARKAAEAEAAKKKKRPSRKPAAPSAAPSAGKPTTLAPAKPPKLEKMQSEDPRLTLQPQLNTTGMADARRNTAIVSVKADIMNITMQPEVANKLMDTTTDMEAVAADEESQAV